MRHSIGFYQDRGQRRLAELQFRRLCPMKSAKLNDKIGDFVILFTAVSRKGSDSAHRDDKSHNNKWRHSGMQIAAV